MFLNLPPEVALEVFQKLLPPEAQQMLETLEQFSPDSNAARYSNLLYSRLHSGHVVISVSEVTPPLYDVRLTPEQFAQSVKDPRFLAQCPRMLDIIFVRNLRDYVKFQDSLSLLREILAQTTVREFLGRIPRISFQLNGRSTTIYAPTLLLALVLSTILMLINVPNVETLKVNSTDIGLYFPDRWGAVFTQFLLLKVLALLDNLLQLPPLLDRRFLWPPNLRVLSLNKNMLSSFTLDLAAQLPNSLVELDLSGNELTSMGEAPQESFSLAEQIPNLRKLNLSFNPYLVRLNHRLLEGAGQMENPLEILLEGCNITDRQGLKNVAIGEQVRLYW